MDGESHELGLEGSLNLLWLLGVNGGVLLSEFWDGASIHYDIYHINNQI